jgi:hypothetical protein
MRNVLAVAAGATLMYLLDPDRGKSRRTALRDQTTHAFRRARRATRRHALDAFNRTHGFVAETRAWVLGEWPPDDVIVDHVRAEMGHVIRYPHWVTASAHSGRVHLSGSVLRNEKQPLLAAIARLSCVLAVEEQLEERDSVDALPFATAAREGSFWPIAQSM